MDQPFEDFFVGLDDGEKSSIRFSISNTSFCKGFVPFTQLRNDIDKWIEPAVRDSKTTIEVCNCAMNKKASTACGHFCDWLLRSNVFPNLRKINPWNNYHLCWLALPKPSSIHVQISGAEETYFLPPVIEDVRKLTVESKLRFRLCRACSHGIPLKEVTSLEPFQQVELPHLRKLSYKTLIMGDWLWTTLNCPSLKKVTCDNNGQTKLISGENVTHLTFSSYNYNERECEILEHKKIFGCFPNVKTLVLKSHRIGLSEGPFQKWKIPAPLELFKQVTVIMKCAESYNWGSFSFKYLKPIQVNNPDPDKEFMIVEPELLLLSLAPTTKDEAGLTKNKNKTSV